MSTASLARMLGPTWRALVALAALSGAAVGCSLVSLDELDAGGGNTGVGAGAGIGSSGTATGTGSSTSSDAGPTSAGATSGEGGGASASNGSSGGDGGAGGSGGQGGEGGSLVVGACQSTPILDRFDREDGPLGDTWVDVVGMAVAGGRAVNDPASTGYNHAAWFRELGPDQEAHVTLAEIDTLGSEQLILLKIVGQANIEVLYSPAEGEVQIWTCTPSCEKLAETAVDVVDGARLAGRATRDGMVIACIDGVQVLAADVTSWPGWEGGGAIGIGTLHFDAAQPPFAFDDFGGGDVAESSRRIE